MRIQYLYHSGILIETERCAIVIDYWKGEIPTFCGKQLYVLVSHSHPDHFCTDVLSWPARQFLFSSDVPVNKKENMQFLQKGDVYEDTCLRVQAFGSTDIGISFLITVDGKTIFHAGDLNNWHWNEESTLQEIQQSEQAFYQELKDIANVIKSVDLVCFPIDKRLGKDYQKGAQAWIDTIPTKAFAPIHFWEDYQSAAAFQSYAQTHHVQCFVWEYPGQSFEL